MKKIVLVTGASSGMGLASCRYLSDLDYIVYASTRDISKFDNNIKNNFIAVEIDLTSQKSIDKVIKNIIKTHNKIDVLVNNAGYGLVSTVEDVAEEQMIAQYNINVFALLRVTKAVIPYMRKNQSGIIINISSFLGRIGLPLLTLYNSSKYAVEGITDSLRHELKEFNIRVHSVMPGFFSTEFAKSNLVVNEKISDKTSAYSQIIEKLTPTVIKQINNGNDPKEVAFTIKEIIENDNFPARVAVGEKAKKFIPMRKELSDEDFERRVREYYGI